MGFYFTMGFNKVSESQYLLRYGNFKETLIVPWNFIPSAFFPRGIKHLYFRLSVRVFLYERSFVRKLLSVTLLSFASNFKSLYSAISSQPLIIYHKVFISGHLVPQKAWFHSISSGLRVLVPG